MCSLDCAEIYATRSERDPDIIAHEALLAPHSYVYSREGIPLAAFGVFEIWPNVWSVWMFTTDAFTGGGEIVRQFRHVIAPAMLSAGCHRVQCDSLIEHWKAHEFIKRFGGRAEFTMRGYGRYREDFIRFYWDRASLQAQVPKLRLARNAGINSQQGVKRASRVVTGI